MAGYRLNDRQYGVLRTAIFVAEYDGEPVVAKDKIVVRRARLVSRVETWNDRTARLFAADCADRALRRAAKRGLTVDGRSKAAVKAARDFANGKISAEELAAAWAAARAAARDAARDAAWDAERNWQIKRLHEYIDGKRGV